MKNFKKRIMGMALTLAMVISALPGISVGAAEGDYMLFNAEFNGADNKALWVPFESNGVKQYTDGRESGTIADGVLTTTPTSAGHGCWGAYWGTENAISAKDGDTYKENIYLETKFKVQGQFASGESKILEVRGHCEANNANEKAMFRAGIINNKLSLGDETKTTETDYTLTLDTWYTIKSRLNFSAKKVYTTITDESGNSKEYESSFMWGANFSNIQSISLHRNDAAGTTYVTDYVRLYDMDNLGTVTASYDGKNLENASNVPNEFVATITFEYEIEEADLEKITVDNNASVQMVLADSNTVMILFSNLKGRTNYTINIPQIGMNAEKKISFTTVDEAYYLFRAEFDGADDKSVWQAFQGNGNSLYTDGRESGTVSNGVLTTTSSSTGFGCWGAYWGADNALSMKDADGNYKQNICFETRFKVQDALVSDEKRIINLMGHCDYNGADYKAFFRASINGGMLSLGSETGTTATDYEISLDTWYEISSKIDFSTKEVYTTITDESGNSETFTSGFMWGCYFSDIQSISMHQNDVAGTTYVTDYVRLYDTDLIEPVEVKYGDDFADLDGAKEIGSDLTATVLFPTEVTEEAVASITIDGGAELSARLSDDNKTATLNISNLDYHTKYTIIIPSVGLNAEKTVSFTTSEDPKYYFRAEFDGIDDTSKWSMIKYDGYGNLGGSIGTVADGVLTTPYVASMSCWGVYFGTGSDALQIPVTKENVYIETKFQIQGAVVDALLMTLSGRRASQDETDHLNFANIEISNGKLAVGNRGEKTETDYSFETDTWYTLKCKVDYSARKVYTTIVDENGKSGSYEAGFTWGLEFHNITGIALHSNGTQGTTYVTDYLRVYDGDYVDVLSFKAEKPVFDKTAVVAGEAITATVNYESPDERDIALIIATYDKDNRLTGITKVETVTEINSADSIELTVTPKTGDVKVKAFCWNSISGMDALTEANEI